MKTNFTRYFLFVLSLILQSLTVQAQAPAIDWAKAYGGSLNDYCFNVKQTPDGGYILVGTSLSSDFDVSNNYGESDAWVVKTDASGNIEWEKNYGGSNQDAIMDVIVLDNDAGYVFLAQTNSNDGDLSPAPHNHIKTWIFQTDMSGIITNDLVMGTVAGNNIPYSFLQNDDGDFIIISEQFQNIWMTKTTGNLNPVWQKFYGGSLHEYPSKIKQTHDGGYIFIGSSQSNDIDVGGNYGESDIWVVKTNEFGTIEWEQNYGGSNWDYGRDIIQNPDGGYMFVGYSGSNDFDFDNNYGLLDIWVVKINESGEILWKQNYGGSNYDQVTSIISSPSGGYIVSGATVSNDGDVTGHIAGFDFWVFEIDPQGNLLWQKPLGGTEEDISYSALLNSNNQIVLAGQSNSNNVDVSGNHGGTDIWLAVLQSTMDISENHFNDITIFPNPVSDKLQVSFTNQIPDKISLYTVYGQEITPRLYIRYSDADQRFTIDVSNLASGTYILKTDTLDSTHCFKIVKK